MLDLNNTRLYKIMLLGENGDQMSFVQQDPMQPRTRCMLLMFVLGDVRMMMMLHLWGSSNVPIFNKLNKEIAKVILC